MRPASLIAAALALSILPHPGSAETFACYRRSYSAEHLARNPQQQVREIRATYYLEHGQPLYNIRVLFRDDVRAFDAFTYCEEASGGLLCMIECDGGLVHVTREGDGPLRLMTDYLRAETSETMAYDNSRGGCSDLVTRAINDLDAQGALKRTTFLLTPRRDEECRDPA
ncbi:MAG: hypothetical protein Q4G26_07690 [Paracoccus sp. (in: a-proteobacteria)]|nr:hypothetical protein [Paracoccus sp. (in: a-proteobacteria)]